MAGLMKFMCMMLVAAAVVSYLNPCLGRMKGKDPYNAAKTTPDRQAVCGSCSGVNHGKPAGLLGQCGISDPYKINPSTDCSKVMRVVNYDGNMYF